MNLPLESARLAPWATACLDGLAAPDDLAEPAVVGGLVHRVVGVPGPDGGDSPVSLPLAVTELRRRGARRAWLAWPVPGDPAGLTGPPELNRLALGAGQAVLVEPLDGVGALALVPSHLGTSGVLWTALPAADPRPAVTSLAEADRLLRTVIRESTEALDRLDVARTRPQDAAAVEAARRAATPIELPPSTPVRARVLLDTAQRLATLLVVARGDDGASVSRTEADRRAEVLRDLDRAVRHAFVAATNALAEETARAR